MSATGLAELLEQMRAHGPDRANVQLDPERIAELTARVVSGEQLQAVQAAEQARIRRHRGAPEPTWQWDDLSSTSAGDTPRRD